MGRFSPSFLIRNKQGTYYFRYIPPKIFTGYDDKRFEIRRSLQTSLKSYAVQRARRILVGVEALMLEFTMKGETTEHPIEWLRKTIDELIRKDEFERKQRQDFFSRILEEASKRLEAPLEVMEFKKTVSAPRKSSQPRLTGLPAKRISEVINAYVIENRVHWREKTREENQFLLNLIVSVLGDRKIGSLMLEDMRIYKEAVLSIPKHRSKLPKYRNLSVKELLQMEMLPPVNIRI